MPRLHHRTFALAAALALGSLAGCATQNYGADKAAAKERWSSARANIVYSLAKQQFEVGDLDKAEQSCAQAISASPNQAEYYELAARIDIERGQLEKAFLKLQEALKKNEKHAPSHFLTGRVLERWQRYEPALESYELAYKHSPTEVAGLQAIAEVLVKMDRSDEAVKRLEEKLDYFENSASLRTTLGRLHMLRGEPAKAVTRLRQALTLAPENVQITEHLALAEVASQNFPDAIDHLTQLLSRKSHANRDDLRTALGDCYIATGRTLEARTVFMDITKRSPNNINAWIKLGEAALIVGDTNRAVEAAGRVTSMAPNRHEGYLLLGMIERNAGRHDSAIAAFDHASRLAPTSALPVILKGMTLEQKGDVKGAVAAYQAALKIAPEDPRPRRLLAGVAN